MISNKRKGLIAATILSGWLILGSLTSVMAQTPVQRHGQLSVKGNRIVDKNGSPVQLMGMSLYWSMWKPAFYNASCVKWLKDDWCVSVVRPAMGVFSNGYAQNPTTEKNRIIAVIDACIANGIYVIVDFHEHEANKYLSQATTFFNEISLKYKGVPNILYETWNEPLAVSWGSVIKPYHQQIINVIRKNDPENIIICGTANWSQRVGDPANDPIAGKNIAYTLHYYADSHKQWLRDAAKSALDKGIALFVTEYGTCAADGSGNINVAESNAWWKFMADNYIGHCNWSIADLGETSAALKTGTGATGNWPASALKPSGILVRDYLRSRCNQGPVYTPVVSLTAPANNSTICAGNSVTITANASISNGSVSKVDFYNGNTLLGSDNSSPYSYVWNNPASGSYSIRAVATSSVGVASNPATAALTVSAPNAPSVTTPVSYCQNGASAALSATGQNLRWYTAATGGTSSATAPVPSTTAAGTSNRYVSQTVNNCESNRAVIVVNINANPAVTITSPADNAVFTSVPATVSINTNVTGSAITNVQFYNGTTLLGQDASSPYSFVWNNVSNGSYTISAKATNTNNCSTSASAKIVVSQVINSLENESVASEIACYPNPFHHSFAISSASSFEYNVYDLTGNKVESGKGINKVKAGENLPLGIYLLKISNAAENKVIKINKQ